MEKINQMTMAIVGLFILGALGMTFWRGFVAKLEGRRLQSPDQLANANMEFIAAALEKVHSMKVDGRMTDEQFETARTKILAAQIAR
jgi:hypothetical protein